MRKPLCIAVAAVMLIGAVACEQPSDDPRTGTTVTEQTSPGIATTTLPAP